MAEGMQGVDSTGRGRRAGRSAALSGLLLATLISGAPTSADASSVTAVAGGGRLASFPLLFRLPGRFTSDPGRYIVFFRTRGRWVKPSGLGTEVGSMVIGDSLTAFDQFHVLQGGPHYCYGWGAAATPSLNRARAGAKVPVEFRLHGTAVQRRRVTLRVASHDLPVHAALPWYRYGNVGRDLNWIGCGSGRA